MCPSDRRAVLLVSLHVAARDDRLALLRALVGEVASDCGCGARCVHDIQLAVDEACQNVIVHGYGDEVPGEIIVDIYRDDAVLVFDLVDFAPPVEVDKVRPRPLGELRPGGLGTHFINECMDENGFCSPPDGAGNRLRMIKRIG